MNEERYSRQLLFSPIAASGQGKLAASTVLVVGAGALGTVICNHLVRSGIGRVRIVDRDYVELSNLQRQMLFDEDDVKDAMPKAAAAKRKLEKINREVKIEAIIGNAASENISELTDGVDLVMDGTDNFATRFLLNDICFKKNIPFSYGGIVGSRGMTALFIPGVTPCFRCLAKGGNNRGQTCDTAGVIAPIVDIISSMQVIEAMKYLTGNLKDLRHTWKTIDVWKNQQYDMKFIKPDPNCPACQTYEYPALQQHAKQHETIMCGRNTVQIQHVSSFNLKEMAAKMEKAAEVKHTPFLLKAHIDPEISLVVFPDGRVLVQGTEDPVAARTVYDRYIGS